VLYDKASDAAPNIDGKSQPELRKGRGWMRKRLKTRQVQVLVVCFPSQFWECDQLF
jgi:hypothetical protein